MRKLIFFAVVLAVISCNTSKIKPNPKMAGAYFMISQTVNDGKKNTKYTDLKQLKIYTDSFFMFAQVNPSDSVSGFGVGSYSTDTGTVIENSSYVGRDTTFTTDPQTYRLNINMTPDGYEQVIPEITINEQKSKLTQEYQKVSIDSITPLDGVWKETEYYLLKGKDTARSTRTQYKAYYAGYFMYSHTYNDAASKIHTGIGFGTFTMDGNTKLKEMDLNSTYSIAVGQAFTIDVEKDGTDHYKQTIVNSDGTKSVEFYERVK
jgi:hypothetical protein